MLVRKIFLAISAICLGGIVQPLPPYMAKAAAPRSRPLRLEGMDYLPARRIILGYGWEPMTGPCEAVEDSECASFPEIDTCSGVSPGYCHMVFMRRNECLDVGTSGGEPVAGQGQSDTHVTDVSFRRGRCWRAAFEASRGHDRGAGRRRAGRTR
jgi:hypothetical protein